MKFTTKSDYPVSVEIGDDSVVLSCSYKSHRADKKTNELKKVEVRENITLTYNELEQIYHQFKKVTEE